MRPFSYLYIYSKSSLHACDKRKDWIEERWIECRSFQVVISSTTYTLWNEYDWEYPIKCSYTFTRTFSEASLVCVYMSLCIVPAAAVFLLLLLLLFYPKALLYERKAIKWLTRALLSNDTRALLVMIARCVNKRILLFSTHRSISNSLELVKQGLRWIKRSWYL